MIEQVPFLEWATPVVLVLKRDRSTRICGDYKLSVNLEATPDVYPLPRVKDLLSSLSTMSCFFQIGFGSRVPATQLGRQFQGTHHYQHLPWAILIQQASICRVICTSNFSTHDGEPIQNLQAVLSKLQSAGMRLSKIGYNISNRGLRPSESKVKALKDAPRPTCTNSSQLKSFVGLVNYYYHICRLHSLHCMNYSNKSKH